MFKEGDLMIYKIILLLQNCKRLLLEGQFVIKDIERSYISEISTGKSKVQCRIVWKIVVCQYIVNINIFYSFNIQVNYLYKPQMKILTFVTFANFFSIAFQQQWPSITEEDQCQRQCKCLNPKFSVAITSDDLIACYRRCGCSIPSSLSKIPTIQNLKNLIGGKQQYFTSSEYQCQKKCNCPKPTLNRAISMTDIVRCYRKCGCPVPSFLSKAATFKNSYSQKQAIQYDEKYPPCKNPFGDRETNCEVPICPWECQNDPFSPKCMKYSNYVRKPQIGCPSYCICKEKGLCIKCREYKKTLRSGCRQCEDRYILDKLGKCIGDCPKYCQCDYLFTKCLRCKPGHARTDLNCTSCRRGWFKDTNGSCLSTCLPGCECQSPGTCSGCLDNYAELKTNCTTCPQGMVLRDPGRCV